MLGNSSNNGTNRSYFYVDVDPEIGVGKPQKMDGENFMENPMNKWMILGGFPLFLVQHPCISKDNDVGSEQNLILAVAGSRFFFDHLNDGRTTSLNW